MDNKYQQGFTLAEALVLLLIVTLLSAAMIPVMTKKQLKNQKKGTWICTSDIFGNHYVKTIYNGIESSFAKTGTSCKFTPPANVTNFKVSAVGGGGGGANGVSSRSETFYNSLQDLQNTVKTVRTSGKYNITMIGGGSSGGAMGCGNENRYNPNDLYTSDEIKAWPVDDATKSKAPYGSVDFKVPVTRFNYSHLWGKSDSEWLKKHKRTVEGVPDYDYSNEDNDHKLCFAKYRSSNKMLISVANSIPMLNFEGLGLNTSDKCWNYPGIGGNSGEEITKNVDLKTGELVHIKVGNAGETPTFNSSKNTEGGYNTTSSDGLINPEKSDYSLYYKESQPGENSEVHIQSQSSPLVVYGGAPAASRIITKVYFDNVPVKNCPLKKVPREKDMNANCQDYGETNCANNSYSCISVTTYDEERKEDVFQSCASKKETVYDYPPDMENCTEVIRNHYYPVNACIYDRKPIPADKHKSDPKKWDYPHLLGKITETIKKIENEPGNNTQEEVRYDVGGQGSGGYGVGNLTNNYLTTKLTTTDNTFRYLFSGSPGEKGFISINRISTNSGGGGGSGQYINRSYKKLPELSIKIGTGGHSNRNGGDTIVGSLFTLKGGSRGQLNYNSKTIIVGGKKIALGGDGESSPMSTNSPYIKPVFGQGGGYLSEEYNGQTVITEATIYGKKYFNWFDEFRFKVYYPNFSDLPGGRAHEIAYGAGGGGGAASEEKSGIGGIGAPGAIIIEW